MWSIVGVTLFIFAYLQAVESVSIHVAHGDPKLRITGDKEVEPHSKPYMAAIFPYTLSPYTEWLCAGSLISDKHVLTSRSCLKKADGANVILGGHNLKANEPEQIKRTSKRIYTDTFDDAAVIALNDYVDETDDVLYVKKLDSGSHYNHNGDVAEICGWGQPDSGSDSLVLRCASSKVREPCNAPLQRCSKGYLRNQLNISDAYSGAPIMSADGRVQLGVASSLNSTAAEYTRLGLLMGWIIQIIV